MSRRLHISRWDFLNGVAPSVAGGALSPLELMAKTGQPGQQFSQAYPPALTGLRGSHAGSF